MKNVIWVVLAIIAIVAILVLRKDEGISDGAIKQEEMSKTYVDQSGAELKAVTSPEKAEVSFGAIGNISLKSSQVNLSGRQYSNSDKSIIFTDRGVVVELSQNGAIIFTGELKDESTVNN